MVTVRQNDRGNYMPPKSWHGKNVANVLSQKEMLAHLGTMECKMSMSNVTSTGLACFILGSKVCDMVCWQYRYIPWLYRQVINNNSYNFWVYIFVGSMRRDDLSSLTWTVTSWQKRVRDTWCRCLASSGGGTWCRHPCWFSRSASRTSRRSPSHGSSWGRAAE